MEISGTHCDHTLSHAASVFTKDFGIRTEQKRGGKKNPDEKGKFQLRKTFQTISDNVTLFSLQLKETKITNRTDGINHIFIHLINKSDYVTKPRYPETSPSKPSQAHHFLKLVPINSQRKKKTGFCCPAMCVGASYLTLVEVAVIESTLPWKRALATVLFKHRNHQHLHL